MWTIELKQPRIEAYCWPSLCVKQGNSQRNTRSLHVPLSTRGSLGLGLHLKFLGLALPLDENALVTFTICSRSSKSIGI